MQETGISLEQIAEYIDSPYNGNETGFYAKLPQKRKRYIGIGMALGQPLDVINIWILKYSGKRRLYIKDVSEDLIWIYLIRLNYKTRQELQKNNNGNAVDLSTVTNYYNMYESCQTTAYVTYRQLWDEVTLGSVDTSDLEILFENVDLDDRFEGLRTFIIDNMDSFKTAYSKPRKMLDRYVGCILKGFVPKSSKPKLNSLRGYLDDSMINYLSGNSNIINSVDRKNGTRTLSTKHIPNNRKTHISLCLALGMTKEEVDHYLVLMGYAPLNPENEDEHNLSRALTLWEKTHPLQRAYKMYCIGKTPEVMKSANARASGMEISGPEEMRKAAESMLQLRQDLRIEYSRRGWEFPYYNDKRVRYGI